MAPVDVASFDRRRPQTPAPFAHATIQSHIPALVREFMLEVGEQPLPQILEMLSVRLADFPQQEAFQARYALAD